MNKTVSISLAGFSFIIEEYAYVKLNDYLQALRSTLEKDEADEVMYDIEIRITEIINESKGKREVVNESDVEKVIAQIGTPEAIGDSEEKQNQSVKNTIEKKQLFRDSSRGKIGGVCVGIAQYIGVDITIMRVLWALLLIFTAFFPVAFIYIILWIGMPEAKTTSDFLKMQGKPINFDSIKDAGQKIGDYYNENRSQIAQRGSEIWNVIRKVLGWIMAFIAVKLLLSIFMIPLLFFGVMGSWSDGVFSFNSNFNELSFVFGNDEMIYILAIIAVLGILIPAFICIALSIKLFSPKTKIRYWGMAVGIMFAILFGLGGFWGSKYVSSKDAYTGYNTEDERISLAIEDNIIRLDLKKIVVPESFKAYGDEKFSDKKKVFERNNPDVYIKRQNVNQPYLLVKKRAGGYNIPIAVKVPVRLIGNTLLLPNYIEYSYKHRLRDFNVEYELILPHNVEIINLRKDEIDIHGDEKVDEEYPELDVDNNEVEERTS